MSLITAHRILIGAAIALFALYALLEMEAYRSSGETSAVVRSLVSLAVAAGFGLYFPTIRKRSERGRKRRAP
jgi:hypothetical protein